MSRKTGLLAIQEGAPAAPLALVPAVKPAPPASSAAPQSRKTPAAGPTTDDESPAYWRRYYDA